MPTAETETTPTIGGTSGIQCEAYDGLTPADEPCQREARFWLEVENSPKLEAICGKHADIWKRWASRFGVRPDQWSIYPM